MIDNTERKLLVSQLMLIIKGSAFPLESYEVFINCKWVKNNNALCVETHLNQWV